MAYPNVGFPVLIGANLCTICHQGCVKIGSSSITAHDCIEETLSYFPVLTIYFSDSMVSS